MRNVRLRLRFEPRDLWVGLYWTREDIASGGGVFGWEWRFYLCLLPALPIVMTFDVGGVPDDAPIFVSNEAAAFLADPSVDIEDTYIPLQGHRG